MRVFSVSGGTNAGKGTFLAYAKAQLRERVHLIQIGAEMRRRHPPEFFNGLGAMPSTEAEVWEILAEQLNKGLADPKVKLILLDGLPRMGGQLPKLLSYFNSFIQYGFVYLHASQETRKKRVEARFPYPPEVQQVIDDENIKMTVKVHEELKKVTSNRDLANKRVVNDILQLSDVLAEISLAGFPINYINTEGPPESYCRCLLEQLWGGPLPQPVEVSLADKSIFDMVSAAWEPSNNSPHNPTPIDTTPKVIEQPHREMNSGTLSDE